MGRYETVDYFALNANNWSISFSRHENQMTAMLIVAGRDDFCAEWVVL